ncbi:hypothetical protein [Rhizobium leguminosarum]|uniref:hypothetical protein n=1 Tax=Rhizobium leguminosarum TaxID=384 RepID=UPI001441B424|nr:hypothetical protein [Rhizobium leguminosarum]MBY5869332.1 hypothetical protein [Rhizobium leguminosarum]NKM08397.1 hypothetical protein [Rhizobium leguminosarum bv. viciae]
MFRPLIAPKIIAIHPAHDDGGASLTWLELDTPVPGGGSATIDLLVDEAIETVTASITRAAAGALVAIITPMAQCNERTGRSWHRGSIGPASELALPPMAPIGDDVDEMDSAIVAPKVIRIYSGEEASEHLSERQVGRPVTVLDLLVSDEPGGIVHLAVGMRPYEVENVLTAARSVRKPLVFWHQRPLAIAHKNTGKFIVFGNIERLDARGVERSPH